MPSPSLVKQMEALMQMIIFCFMAGVLTAGPCPGAINLRKQDIRTVISPIILFT